MIGGTEARWFLLASLQRERKLNGGQDRESGAVLILPALLMHVSLRLTRVYALIDTKTVATNQLIDCPRATTASGLVVVKRIATVLLKQQHIAGRK
jgi:hypothetical protein